MKYESNRFFIIDGSSLMFRAFFALPLLTTSSGKYINAIYGFTKMFLNVYEELQPQYVVVAFDKSRHTFRTELFKDYKGTRSKTPDELVSQIPILEQFTNAFGIKFIEVDNYEADDIIGTLATKAAAAGVESLVITGDRDALQLIRPNLKIVMTKKGVSDTLIYDDAVFQKEYGIEPKKLIDLKALMGDKSDNIPGVFGVGEKTALKLLIEYHSLTGIYDNLDKIGGKKLKEKLIKDKDMAFLSYKLATINCQMDLAFTPEDFVVTPDKKNLKVFCDEFELRNLWHSLEKLSGNDNEKTVQNMKDVCTYQTVDEASIAAFVEKLKVADIFAYLPVFSGKVPHMDCHGFMFVQDVDGERQVVFVPCLSQFNKYIDELFHCAAIKVTYNLKNTLHCGYELSGKVMDIMVAAYMLNPAVNNYELANLSDKYLGEDIAVYDMKGADATVEKQAAYYQQVLSLTKLADNMIHELHDKKIYALYENTELPLEKVLVSMEEYGVYINSDKLQAMSVEIGKTIEDLLTDIYKLAEVEFNVNSPKQLGEILFDKLGLPVQKKTKTGYSTNAEVLEILRPCHPIVDKILEYRMWNKLKSTYLDSMYDLIDEKTKRIHTTFNQTVTATGRLSSSDPNLQNIPVRTDAGKKIRSLFEPEEPYKLFLSADYSQIELRVLAHMSDDKTFIDAFCLNQDIHARTASEVFGVSFDEVTPQMRRQAKAINFGLVYGKSDYGLAQELNISRKEAADYINNYFARYEGVKKYLKEIVEQAHELGYTTTLFGRRRYLPGIKSNNGIIRKQNERMAMNTPIQGTAADIIKMAMIATWDKIHKLKLKSRILLQVHDELVIETVEEEVSTLKKILKETMQDVVDLKVPLTIDINTGTDWANTK